MRVNFGGQSYEMTAGWGAHDNWHHTGHTGIDIGMQCGSMVKAPVDGIIEQVVDYGSQNIGKGIIMDAGNGEHLIFGHLSENGGVHVGQHILQNQVIGISGSTGRSSGCHLHLGAKNDLGQFIDPSKYLDGTQHVASSLVGTLNSSLHSFTDTVASWSLQLIDFSLSLAIHIGPQVLDLVLSLIC